MPSLLYRIMVETCAAAEAHAADLAVRLVGEEASTPELVLVEIFPVIALRT